MSPGKLRSLRQPRNLLPEAQSTVPKLEVVPAKPVPVAPRPGSGITHTEDLGKANGRRTGDRDVSRSGGRGSLTPFHAGILAPSSAGKGGPQRAKASPTAPLSLRRDRQGVIHITNVPLEDEGLAAPLSPAPVVHEQALPPDGALPTLQMASFQVPALARSRYGLPARLPRPPGGCRVRSSDRRLGTTLKPSFGVTPRLRPAKPFTVSGTPGASGTSSMSPPRTRRHSQARVAAYGGEAAAPGTAQGLAEPSMPPAMAWGPGFVKPRPGASGVDGCRPARPSGRLAYFYPAVPVNSCRIRIAPGIFWGDFPRLCNLASSRRLSCISCRFP